MCQLYVENITNVRDTVGQARCVTKYKLWCKSIYQMKAHDELISIKIFIFVWDYPLTWPKMAKIDKIRPILP